jgi:hypothetical protein
MNIGDQNSCLMIVQGAKEVRNWRPGHNETPSEASTAPRGGLSHKLQTRKRFEQARGDWRFSPDKNTQTQATKPGSLGHCRKGCLRFFLVGDPQKSVYTSDLVIFGFQSLWTLSPYGYPSQTFFPGVQPPQTPRSSLRSGPRMILLRRPHQASANTMLSRTVGEPGEPSGLRLTPTQ